VVFLRGGVERIGVASFDKVEARFLASVDQTLGYLATGAEDEVKGISPKSRD
jgi:hypothetical protein